MLVPGIREPDARPGLHSSFLTLGQRRRTCLARRAAPCAWMTQHTTFFKPTASMCLNLSSTRTTLHVSSNVRSPHLSSLCARVCGVCMRACVCEPNTCTALHFCLLACSIKLVWLCCNAGMAEHEAAVSAWSQSWDSFSQAELQFYAATCV